jgi:hypothetical protein
MTLSGFENESLATVDFLDNDLREGDIGKFEFTLISRLFEANIEDIN